METTSRPTRPVRSIVALTAVALLALAACGDDGGDTASPEGGEESTSREDATDDATDDASDGGAGGDAGAAGCAVDAETVSAIVGSEFVFNDTSTAVDDALTCLFDATDGSGQSASVTEGDWDGSDDAVDRITSATESHFGEPTDTPDDLGDRAFLWNEEGEIQTFLMVFVDDSYYTAVVFGFDADIDEQRSMAISLYEAAR